MKYLYNFYSWLPSALWMDHMSWYWKPQKIWSGSSQLAEACRIYSSLVPAWRWMNIDVSTMMLLSSSGRRCAEDQSITVETLGGFSSTFKLAPENCITRRRFLITTWKRLEWLGWWVTPTLSWCGKDLSGQVETRYVASPKTLARSIRDKSDASAATLQLSSFSD